AGETAEGPCEAPPCAGAAPGAGRATVLAPTGRRDWPGRSVLRGRNRAARSSCTSHREPRTFEEKVTALSAHGAKKPKRPTSMGSGLPPRLPDALRQPGRSAASR